MTTTAREPSALIDAAVGVMQDLAIHPLALEIDDDGVRILAAMRGHALRTRSRGPYSQDNLPPEALDMAAWIDLRFSVRAEPVELTIEGGGPWPRLLMQLPARRVVVRYVVPEDAPPGYQPEPNEVTLVGDLRLALGYLASSLRRVGARLGGEPAVTLTLSYPDDPNYERNVTGIPEEFRRLIPPVVSNVRVDRSRFSRKQRAAHDEALRESAYSDQPLEPWERHGFTTRIGSARVQVSGS
ncbi:hypothetical protein ABT023_13020 [Micromonospora sp. NPDC002296]|uniref:hypothetical protein n=1 Tax=Micromonospora sp. NPDC002296 TaxID=3154271 RepID=UPI003323F262